MADKSGLQQNLTFGVWDYAVFILVLALTAFIGLYHVWRAKREMNIREFLVADRRIGIVPLALSLTATTLTPATMIGTPTEAYCNGVQMCIGGIAKILSKLFAAYAILPVFYELNVSTFNQYVEYRFNRLLRTVPAFMSLLQSSIYNAAITYVTAVILTKATGLHVWWSVLLVAGICIVYSSLGGVSAVIYTDVLQITIIFITLAVMLVNGLMVIGGVAKMWEINARGHRTTWAYFEPDPHSNYTVWSMVIGYFSIQIGYSSTNQSELQRQLANKTMAGARKMTLLSIVAMCSATWIVIFIGMLIYARYFDCDPLLDGEVSSRDMLTAKFAGEMFANSPGMYGLYVAAILCATLSTLSSMINSFATVTLMDLVKPLMPEMSDAMTTFISKSIGILYGVLIISMTAVSQSLGGLVQAIVGTSVGPTAGILLLGLFFPWATAKGATVGYVGGLCIGWWMAVGRMIVGAPYKTAPLSTIGCNSSLHDAGNNMYLAQAQTNLTDMTSSDNTISHVEEQEAFFLYLIIPLWYCLITMTTVIIVGLTTSFVTGSEDLQKLNPKLISPLTKWVASLLPEGLQRKSGLAALLANERKLSALNVISDDVKHDDVIELQTLKSVQ